MNSALNIKKIIDTEYNGKILNEKYSKELKKKVRAYLEYFYNFEQVDMPILTYLAAWDEGCSSIWYEFVSKQFVELMGCKFEEINGVFRNSVIDRRVYKYLKKDVDVEKDIISRRELSVSRKKLRQEGKKSGEIDAVYKVFREEGRAIWLKDKAKIEIFKRDKICLSPGYMTDISKEMEASEENERRAAKLEKDIKN